VTSTSAGATWDLGPSVGELESLAVAPEGRRAGIGHRLIDECRALLRAKPSRVLVGLGGRVER
jgi:ribosomal protein S18 acetylase RimI-like enzyme